MNTNEKLAVVVACLSIFGMGILFAEERWTDACWPLCNAMWCYNYITKPEKE